MSKRWLVVVCVAFVALSVIAMAPAAPTARSRRAFAGPVHWEFPGLFASQCEFIATVAESPGRATHMGKAMLSSSHCPGEPDNHADGFGTIAAANGDELYMVYDYDLLDQGNEMVVAFKEGRGRFAAATGEASGPTTNPEFIDGCESEDPFDCMDFLVPWQWWSTLEGSISC